MPGKYGEVVYGSMSDAFRAGDEAVENYRFSRKADNECLHTLERLLETDSKQGRLERSDWIGDVVEEYGEDRVGSILAVSILAGGDIYSDAEKDWAKNQQIWEEMSVCSQNILMASSSLISALANAFAPATIEKIERSEDEKGYKLNVPASSLKKSSESDFEFYMPEGEFSGYSYILPSENVAKADDRYTLSVPEDYNVRISKGDSVSVLPAERFAALLSGASLKKFQKNTIQDSDIEITLKKDAFLEKTGHVWHFALPSGQDSFYVSDGHISEDTLHYIISVPHYMSFRIHSLDGKYEGKLTASELKTEVEKKTEEPKRMRGRPRKIEPQGPTPLVSLNFPEAAKIKTYDKNTLMRMPRGEFEGRTFYLPTERIHSTVPGFFACDLPAGDMIIIRPIEKGGEPSNMDVRTFADLISRAEPEDYAMSRDGMTDFFIPAESFVVERDRSVRFVLPKSEKIITLGNGLLEKRENGYLASMPSSFDIQVMGESSMSAPSVKRLYDACRPDDFKKPEMLDEAKIVHLPNAALVSDGEKRTMFKMPDGPLENGTYYYQKTLITKTDTGFNLIVPQVGTVSVYGLADNGVKKLSSVMFYNAVRDKDANDYKGEFILPSKQGRNPITVEREKKLRDSVPKEMLKRKKWVAMSTFRDFNKEKKSKIPKNPNSDDCSNAKIDDPATWGSFDDAIKFARKNGCESVAYALTEDDDVAVFDMDKCIDPMGDVSSKAKSLADALPEGTYIERSVSGNGLHFFGSMKDVPQDIKIYSNDGSIEFYSQGHFMTMTGECTNGAGNLVSFDDENVKFFMSNNFESRKRYDAKANKGIDGITSLTEREVIEKALSSRNSDEFKRLWAGIDVKGDMSRSDFAMMCHLAFWCNGDKDMMLSLFRQSGLYRPQKKDSYYELTALKACDSTPQRYSGGKVKDARTGEVIANKKKKE